MRYILSFNTTCVSPCPSYHLSHRTWFTYSQLAVLKVLTPLRYRSQVTNIQHTGLRPVIGRYVMLTVDQTPCGWDNRSRVFELNIYGSLPPAGAVASVAMPLPNIAFGKTTVASTFLVVGTTECVNFHPCQNSDVVGTLITFIHLSQQ